MNDKFFGLPEEKQERIIQAAYRVFARNTYKKSPMHEIAGMAGISKSLLFHYFRNKHELYLFLWEKCAKVTIDRLKRYGCYDSRDLFEMMHRGMRAKLQIFRECPDMAYFAVRAFYEKDEAICEDIQKSYQKFFGWKAQKALQDVDLEQFVPGLNLRMMYREMCWASEGYLWEMLQRGGLDVDAIERDFEKLLDFWKSIYLRRD